MIIFKLFDNLFSKISFSLYNMHNYTPMSIFATIFLLYTYFSVKYNDLPPVIFIIPEAFGLDSLSFSHAARP